MLPLENKDLYEEVLALVQKEGLPPPAAIRKLRLGRLLHKLGFHTWVKMRVFDAASRRILRTGLTVCAFCSKGRPS